jgi:hypothetical protein
MQIPRSARDDKSFSGLKLIRLKLIYLKLRRELPSYYRPELAIISANNAGK